LSIISLLNEKFSENAQPLQSFYSDDDNDKLQIIFNFVLFKFPSTDLSLSQKTLITTFLVYALLCFDIIPVRQYWLKYFSLSIWKSLSPERLNKELQATPQLENHWNHLNERLNEDATEATEATSASPAKRKVKSSKGSSSKKQKVDPQVEMEFQWFPSLVEDFLAELDCPADDNSNLRAQYLEKLCELFIDLLSQLPTRRFVHSLLDDYHLIVRCQRSALGQSGNLHELIFQLNSVFTFGVENQTGKCYSSHEIIGLKNQELQRLQQIAYSNFRETLSDLIFSSSGELGKEVNLRKILSLISTESLIDLAKKLGYVSSTPRSSDCALTSEFLLDIFVEKLCFRPSEITSTLYPTGKSPPFLLSFQK
jgi:intron-binding protein aquarius